LVYYQCPMLCNLILNGLLESIKNIDWDVGKQYEIVAVSINPDETPELARKKKETYLESYGRPKTHEGWHFLTGEQGAIQSLSSQVGFDYRYDEKEKQYLHAAAIYILTPDGQISRYLYGMSFPSQNLKLALLEGSRGKISLTTTDRVLLFCFHFDPSKNSYTFRVWRIVQMVLFAQVIAFSVMMYLLWRKKD
jgi:protein SCO1/2